MVIDAIFYFFVAQL